MFTQVQNIARSDFKSKLVVGCLHVGASNYSQSTGINVSAVDFEANVPIISLIVCAGSGNISIEYQNGGRLTIPVTVAVGSSMEILKGHLIKKIISGETTFNGAIFPLF